MNKFHRYISFFLCLALTVFCLSPIQASAYYVDPFSSTGYAVVGGIAADAISEFSKFVASILASASDSVADAISADSLHKFTQWGAFIASKGMYKSIVSSETEEFTEKSQTTGTKMVLTPELFSILSASYQELYGETLVLPAEGLEIYVPPDTLWSSGELITYSRLTSQGFHDLSELNDNILAGNKISWQIFKNLNGLELFLRTTNLEEIGAHFDSLESTFSTSITSLVNRIGNLENILNTAIGNVETSVDVMSSTLHKDIADLKSVYSSFGNETLDKLDTLNESIKAIDSSSSLSVDFVNLRETIMQYDSLILTAVQDLPDLISQSLNDFYVTQSAQLEEISSKLGTFEESFLETMTSDLQLIRDDVSSGFADVVVALDQIDTPSYINFQPVIDQLISSEATLFSGLDSIYNLIYENFVDLSVSNNELLSSVSTLLSENYIEFFNYFSDDLWGIWEEFQALNNSILSDLFSSLEVTVDNRLETIELNLQDTYSLFDDQILGSLSEIKTAIHRIADTTTVDPDTSDYDDLENKKIPLYGSVVAGFDKGNEYFGFSGDFLSDDLNGFLVAGLIFNEFADMSFFHRLIVISASIGLVGTLLGMALYAQSFNLYNRRREEVAQARANSRFKGLEVYYG